jgi:sec-independent protein translocase protein TatC
MKLIPGRRTPEKRTGTMSVVEHLEELRHRIIVCLWAVGIAAIGAWFLWNPFILLIQKPYCDFIESRPDLRPDTGCDLVFLGPFDGFMVRMKGVFIIALVLALPVVLYQLWAFIAPGLTAREKKWSIPFVVSSCLLFLLGAATAYYVLPKSLGFLLGFAGAATVPILTIDRYVAFVTLMALAFGVSFLLPVILVFLELVGLVTPQTLAKGRRYAILGIAIFAAIITPGSDMVSMVALFIPMYLFFEAAIIIGRLARRGSKAA